jgi:hypothetical protein
MEAIYLEIFLEERGINMAARYYDDAIAAKLKK